MHPRQSQLRDSPASAGAVFGGWNQFGVVGSVAEAYHGAQAARVSGPNIGGWDVSGFWQRQDCGPGEQWEATGHVRHPAGNPLTGPVRGPGQHRVARRRRRPDQLRLLHRRRRLLADGRVHRFLGGERPGPDGHGRDSSCCSASCRARPTLRPMSTSTRSPSSAPRPPTIDDMQWNDFPGGNTLEFGGHTWRVKGPGYYGPGTNYFCDAADCVWVDGERPAAPDAQEPRRRPGTAPKWPPRRRSATATTS